MGSVEILHSSVDNTYVEAVGASVSGEVDGGGGGVFLRWVDHARVENTTFTGCVAREAEPGQAASIWGGAFAFAGRTGASAPNATVELVDVGFYGNVVVAPTSTLFAVGGAAVFGSANATLTRPIAHDNAVVGGPGGAGGGAIAMAHSRAAVSELDAYNNTVSITAATDKKAAGGGIFAVATALTLSDSHFDRCKTLNEQVGLGVAFVASVVNVAWLSRPNAKPVSEFLLVVD